MTDYFYDMDLVVDPLNPSNVVANGLVSIFDPADTAGTTLLALKDPSGLPLPNPLRSNTNGFLPPRIASLPQTMWKSGTFTGYFNSYKGLRDESVAAVSAAQAAADSATSAASQVVTTAAVDGTGALVLTKASGATVNAGNVKGATGPAGPKGDKGADGANVLPTDDAIKQAINDTASATRGALNATYAPSQGSPNYVWKVKPDEASIRAAWAAAQAAGGGEIRIPENISPLGIWSPINLTGNLPDVFPGLRVIGVPPQQKQTVVNPGNYIADGAPTFTGGTVFKGDGTFPLFNANSTDLAAPTATVGNGQISGVQIYGIGGDNFTYGLHVGAKNQMGLIYSKLDELYFINCSQWGVKLVNFVHCDVGFIGTWLCQNGQYYGAQMDSLTYQGGNTNFRELFTLLPQDGRDRRLCRGIVFDAMGGTAGNGGAMNEIQAQRIQHNSYNKTLLTVTATLTSGNTSIAVPDGTKFLPGMIVTFTATNYGFTLGQAYVVQSVSGNNLTIGGSRNGAVINPSGSGTLTLNTYGFPCIEVTSSDSLSHVTSTFINHIDVEGTSSAGLYLENPSRCEFGISSNPNVTLVDIISRNAAFSVIKSKPIVSTDFDANSTSSEFWGPRKASFQRYLKGATYDSSIATNVFQLGGGNNNQNGGDLQLRAGFVYPSGGMGERVFPRDSAITLGGVNCGDLIFNGSASQTWTLPTIVTDSGSSNLAGSHVGLVFDILHYGAGTLTIATDGTQLMNKIAGRTSTTLTAGNGLKFIAARDNSGNLFWAVKTVTLLA